MLSADDFRPTASLTALRWRGEILRTIREVFHTHGYLEVEVPLLSHDGPVDPHLDAFTVEVGRGTRALQTSPEFGLKRLVAAGAGPVYQLGKAFRRGERGQRHNPEFTMLEWYRVGETYREQMDFVTELVSVCSLTTSGSDWGRFVRTTYRDAFHKHVGVDVARATTRDLLAAAQRAGLVVPGISEADRDGWLNLLLAELVEPRLGIERPEFLCDYPASQSALARVRDGEFPVAERFELYMEGVEICNGYTELTDAAEMRARMARESSRRAELGQPPLRESNRLLAALEHGLPDCAGVALGVDRLLMALVSTRAIDDVIAFPWERA